ncbi:macrophage mannose receptor 1-like [Antedon mediterranea]|uniref:macrophage mannose receptor 1-like n=1 Tax=Antedon mediterranea TaxID=105859 RepID=UPI003AF73E94
MLEYKPEMTWSDAKADCKSSGGYLVSLLTSGEVTAVLEYVNEFYGKGVYVIGLSRQAGLDKDVDANWKWEIGQTFGSNIGWYHDEPNSNKSDIAGVAIRTSDVKLKDYNAEDKLRSHIDGYICEKSNLNYKWSRYTVKMLHDQRAMTWFDAKTDCVHSDGYLLSFLTDDELTTVLDYVNTVYGKGVYAIGLSRQAGLDNDVDTNWKWETGQDFDSSIIPWSPLDPYNSVTSKTGVRIDTTDIALKEIDAETTLNSNSDGYICEYRDGELDYRWSRYIVTKSATTWSDAKAGCESSGGYLVSFLTNDELNLVLDYVNVFCGAGVYVIGLSREAGLDGSVDKKWKWEIGQEFGSNIAWNRNYPDTNVTSKAGVRIHTTNSVLMDTDTEASLNSDGYICELNSELTYRWSRYTVKMLNNQLEMTWSDAKANCESSGGYLVSLLTSDELNAVLEYVHIVYGAGSYVIGLSRQAGLGNKGDPGLYYSLSWYTVTMLDDQKETTWSDAKADCESSGGYLVTLLNDHEVTAVLDYVNTVYGASGYAIGLSRQAGLEIKNDKNWKWETDQHFNSSIIPWVPSDPNSIKTKRAGVALFTNSVKLVDVDADEDLNRYFKGFICEESYAEFLHKRSRYILTTLHSGTTMTWSDAKADCASSGGYLASLLTNDEVTAVLEHVNSVHKGIYAIGLSRQVGLGNEDTNWKWETGQDFDSSIAWNPEDPGTSREVIAGTRIDTKGMMLLDVDATADLNSNSDGYICEQDMSVYFQSAEPRGVNSGVSEFGVKMTVEYMRCALQCLRKDNCQGFHIDTSAGCQIEEGVNKYNERRYLKQFVFRNKRVGLLYNKPAIFPFVL